VGHGDVGVSGGVYRYVLFSRFGGDNADLELMFAKAGLGEVGGVGSQSRRGEGLLGETGVDAKYIDCELGEEDGVEGAEEEHTAVMAYCFARSNGADSDIFIDAGSAAKTPAKYPAKRRRGVREGISAVKWSRVK